MSAFERKPQAEKIIRSYTTKSMFAGAVPIPLMDVALSTGFQMAMLKELCLLYQINYSENFSKALMSSLASSVGAKVGASLTKGVPFVGAIISTPVMVGLSGILTHSLGHAVVKYLEVNKAVRSITDIDTNKLFELVKQGIDESKKKVGEMVDNVTGSGGLGWKKKFGNIFSKKNTPVFSEVAAEKNVVDPLARGTIVFGNTKDSMEWFQTPNKMTGQKTPMDLYKEGEKETVNYMLDLVEQDGVDFLRVV